jgi:hypothetical protein
MISHSKKFIFVHIPKTGGTSVERMLRKYGIVLQGRGNFDSMYYKHATAESIKRMMGAEYDKYFKFTIVRNPWDWIVSNYAFNRGLGRPWIIGTGYSLSGKVPDWAKDISFSEWLPWWIDTLNPSQSVMFTGTNGESLVDAIFRFESLTSDFNKLKTRLQLRLWRSRLPHLKKSNRRADYKSYYDDKSMKLVQEHFALDIKYWGSGESDKANALP